MGFRGVPFEAFVRVGVAKTLVGDSLLIKIDAGLGRAIDCTHRIISKWCPESLYDKIAFAAHVQSVTQTWRCILIHLNLGVVIAVM